MPKPFLTYTQQIEKLENEKGLLIPDKETALDALHRIGYFSLIGGYKTPFINPMTRVYEANTTIEDIIALYTFDKDLRELTFRYLTEIERHLRQLISYEFCKFHGELQQEYLNPDNYNNTPGNAKGIQKLLSGLSFRANEDNEHSYVVHQRKTYGNVPLWVLMNTLTFGQLSHFYSYLPDSLKAAVSMELPYVNEHELEQYLTTLTLFRNVCAHNERLFSYRLQRKDFPDNILHQKLGIPIQKGHYTCGKRDYFGVMIAFRYLLSGNSFKEYKAALTRALKAFRNRSSRIPVQLLLEYMGFPENWEKITRYKVN